MQAGARVRLASGYFNMTETYIADVVNWSKARYDILAAAPRVSEINVVNVILTKIFRINQVGTMPADVLGLSVTRTSAAMILTVELGCCGLA